MSEFSPETTPQILVNGEGHGAQQDNPDAEREETSPVSLNGELTEDSSADNEAQAKVHTLFQQVRNQIRSQVGNKAPKSSIMELVQKVRDMEMIAQVDVNPEGKDVEQDELCAAFEKKLEASRRALKGEFEEQICQVRREMQAYTDHALKDLERKMQQTQPKEQERNGPDKKPKLSASRRGRLLTRTMTTITPKTCAPVIIGPRAKSETLASPKAERAGLQPRDLALCLPGNRPYHSRKPLPPACPPVHQRKKPVQAKAKAAK